MINPVPFVSDLVTLFTVLQGTCVLETVKLALDSSFTLNNS